MHFPLAKEWQGMMRYFVILALILWNTREVVVLQSLFDYFCNAPIELTVNNFRLSYSTIVLYSRDSGVARDII